MTRVVIVATPASGRDTHRLVAGGASVYGNAEKAAMIHRLLTGWSCRCAHRWRC
jgi:predicted polyphosphate/ATP-dependent NAD kinase